LKERQEIKRRLIERKRERERERKRERGKPLFAPFLILPNKKEF
jgi:hypothetical protein